MSLRPLPELQARRLPDVCAFHVDDDALNRFEPLAPRAALDEASISILDVIGYDDWTGEGVTSKRISSALRSIGEQPVTVNLNSPGGDFFEGVAIYNILRQHPAKVTINILGLAASSASVIAMAGDEVRIGKTGFLMVHNAWVVAVGNRHDLAEAATTMEPFDDAMASLYADRSGKKKAQAIRWMDEETWFNGEQAVELGLADAFLAGDAAIATAAKPEVKAERRTENALIRAGVSRGDRRSLIAALKGGKQDAAPDAMQDAGTLAALAQLSATIRS
jgi:ATP-dependent protease ClpP protease subunit